MYQTYQTCTSHALWAGPDDSFDHAVARNSEVRNGTDVCHWGCPYAVLQTVQRYGVCSAVYGTMYNKEPFVSVDKSREQSPLWASPCRDIAMIMQKAT